ncbi:hypothetical protein [Streptomyces adelaidensis]|uniref:hypothetical protein n=1 Tax=Streptomyces adelaidensis TaxID=2796465 RepID=UPI0019041DC9|nr:hypothetical protein [Streptomyces adelaidensis]
MRITARLHRPARHYGGTLGIAKWEYTRHIGDRTVLFEITHDPATRTTSIRTYPGAGWTPPSHNFTIRGLTARQITVRITA